MSRLKSTVIAFVFVATCLAILPTDANADGPLRRWLRGFGTCCKKPAANACCPPQAAAAPNPYNLKPGQCMKTCQQTCTRTVVNYVPCTAYRTVTKRVPVTQYRPETKTDPCTGCVITCMKPCTSYTYQCQRVPYTTYRPVYRQETYKVPVTTITNDCATGTCATGTCATGTCATAGCSTCGPGQGQPMAPNYGPMPTPAPQTNTTYEAAPGFSTNNNFGAGGFTPADQTPSLESVVDPASAQRPVSNRLNSGAISGYQTSIAPVVRTNVRTAAAHSPIRKQWGYTPVRMASYEKPAMRNPSLSPVPPSAPINNQVRSTVPFRPVTQSGWVEVN